MISLCNLNEIECFRAVARLGSFSEAADELGMNKNSVSRFVANLEEKLGEKLFRRTTREVSLTVFGESLLKKSEAFWQSLFKLRG